MEGMHMGQDASPEKDFSIGVNLEINDGDKIMTATPKIKYKGDNEEYIPAEINEKYLIFFSKMEVKSQEDGESRISLSVKDANEPKQQTQEETLLITASIKPFINVLWIGTAILVIGFIVSLVRRGGELKSRTDVNEKQE